MSYFVTINRIQSKVVPEIDWYIAQQVLANGAIASGHGSTMAKAINQCNSDIALILSLQ